jgi:hypothetical protein
LHDVYAAGAKQSILKKLDAVKSFLSQREILQPERLPPFLEQRNIRLKSRPNRGGFS